MSNQMKNLVENVSGLISHEVMDEGLKLADDAHTLMLTSDLRALYFLCAPENGGITPPTSLIDAIQTLSVHIQTLQASSKKEHEDNKEEEENRKDEDANKDKVKKPRLEEEEQGDGEGDLASSSMSSPIDMLQSTVNLLKESLCRIEGEGKEDKESTSAAVCDEKSQMSSISSPPSKST